MKPRWFSWRPKGMEAFECRQRYDRADDAESVIIKIEVKGKANGKVGTFSARFLFRREQLRTARADVDAVMVKAFAEKWLGAMVSGLYGDKPVATDA